ncbi:hypothetical protein [Flexivirga oryzae]|uniref:Uncharacterized protein n=1 Tax=Flexivirga oryzae TaxID=1794944 RepID=A0A839N2E6_9MICO|nr:hypothetical protein [Flexivirga oryzae]MBB2891888.1 hypothetical protein [Flexivirga oryzae]
MSLEPTADDGAASTVTPPDRWATATADTRAAAKWLTVSLAAAGALVFGAGPIVSRPSLSWTDDRTQLLVAGVFGLCGIFALVLLISRFARLLAPRRLTLRTIPKDLETDLDADPEKRLPSDCKTYREFLQNYDNTVILIENLQSKLSNTGGSAEQGKITEWLKQAHDRLDVYTLSAESYLSQAEFYAVSNSFDKTSTLSVVLAVGAAVGALGFQLSLTSAPETSTPSPTLGYLVGKTSAAPLWKDLDLAKCALAGRVPVIVNSGSGTGADPYNVTVISTRAGCQAKTFELHPGTLTVEDLPSQEVTIQVQVSATPSTSE